MKWKDQSQSQVDSSSNPNFVALTNFLNSSELELPIMQCYCKDAIR